MSLKNINPTKTIAWQKLNDHFENIKYNSIKSYFKEDALRAENFTIKWKDFYVDFSKNRINNKTLGLFNELLNQVELKDAINKYFSGHLINKTENRAVLHTALRSKKDQGIIINGEEIFSKINNVKNKIRLFSNSIISGSSKGFTNKAFTDIVNIGIGGSDLGPAMVVDSLKYYKNNLNTHFVSNIDGDHVSEILKDLNPETTLFVIVSKTFTTQETISNANTIRSWFLQNANKKDVSKHFIAVSTNISEVIKFGIDEKNIFPMWDWVGGRFSLWSTVGLSICLSVGYNNFSKLLEGASEMDSHFRNSEFSENIPVVLACLSLWYNNFFNYSTHALIPYSEDLKSFSKYLQQASMESNGKQTDRSGNFVDYQTGQVIWGQTGTNAQHSFFQLLHQGTKIIPADFIGFKKPLNGNNAHHDILMANFFAQTKALMQGTIDPQSDNHREFMGNRPTNTLLIDKLTPESLGSLIAMYEHKIFTLGVIWNILSFDQFGVELGKKLAKTILNDLKTNDFNAHDLSTQALLKKFKSTE
jgi:glucose-6-phosphate isomerase